MSHAQRDGRVAIVTGGSSGIGRAIALRLAQDGAAVAVADLQPAPREGGAPTHNAVQETGGRALFVQTDVADAAGDRAARAGCATGRRPAPAGALRFADELIARRVRQRNRRHAAYPPSPQPVRECRRGVR